MPLGHGDFKLAARWKLGRELKQNQYTQAIVLPNSLKSALIPFFAGIKKRTGWKGESRFGLLNDLRSNKNTFPLMVQRYIALAFPRQQMRAAKDIQEIPYPALLVDKAQQQTAIARLGINLDKPVLGLCPGAEFGPSKRWPEAHYAAIAKQWIADGGEVWVFGSQKDQPVANTIRQYLPEGLQTHCRLLAGNTSLTEAIDLLAACTTVVSNDSGLMHIAAAVNTPLVAVYGSTSPGYTPPLSQKVQIVHTDIECRPCFKRECPYGHLKCLRELQPNQVWQALLALK
jgi:heptosyltransferase-2